ncbi:rhamnogalacturonate lyase [Verticillium alfalfae VaMs.102]|uniref:rhamnogalacturonan endolyase n=1 Tax=Verticillium alfalfae (strain VaMs.102 / ATCC MYA-4576 / FGSC 10136) TaxID=526221 RepID=C9SKZ3_VERA1|nr:rhamnogalacturonate lyase [Verticillium alfalfae VaMs.102]EEY19361.1 rhamnogalacturonate lyase [Verticillium alfalfae VaMs.102]
MRLAGLKSAALFVGAATALKAAENATHYTLQNERLYVAVGKSNGQVVDLSLDNVDLLGPVSGNSGKVGSEDNWAPKVSAAGSAAGVTVQDATTYVGNTPNDPYASQYSDYFTKYTFAELWRNHDVHGQYADGSTSPDGNTYGAWLVHNTRETYYGGPLHSDLVVDGIVYNYMVSGHHGAPVPNITHGFDRTFGPQFYYFNQGGPKTSLEDLRQDAAQYADPEWNAEFYDSIAKHVPNYAPTSQRTTFTANIKLPRGAKRVIAVLSENKQDFQLNVFNTKSLQYWAEVGCNGKIKIPRVKEGTYRLTVYADGVFGWFIQDDVKVSSTEPHGLGGGSGALEWKEESAGKEIWRIGKPDKSAGEYRHGYAPDTSKPLQPEQYRIYWAQWDFPTDFPEGVNYKVGESKADVDFNYIHWSVFGGRGNSVRPEQVRDKINNWTVEFDLDRDQLQSAKTATLTVQLAGAKTANGNNKWGGILPGEKYSNLPYTVALNGVEEETWVIPYWRSGSCGVRSAVVCQNIEYKFRFSAANLEEGANKFVLSLPYNATNTEGALLVNALYVQYDALRFELE